MTIKIEKNIPVPTRSPSTIAATARLMKDGDSVLLERKKANYLYLAIRKTTNLKSVIRTEGKFSRVWAVKAK